MVTFQPAKAILIALILGADLSTARAYSDNPAESYKLPFQAPTSNDYMNLPAANSDISERVEYQFTDPKTALPEAWSGKWIKHSEIPHKPKATNQRFWIRVPVRNTLDEEERYVFHSASDYSFDSAQFWMVAPDLTAMIGRSGSQNPGAKRDVLSLMPGGAFDLDPGENAWLVGTTYSPEATQHDFKIHTQRDFDQLNLEITGFLCAYIGILGMIALTTLVFGIALKDPVTRWYGIFCVSMSGVAIVSYGLLDTFFTVPFPFGANSLGRALPLLSIFPSAQFISKFLETKKHLPRVHHFIMFNAWASLIVGLIRFVPATHSYSLVMGDVLLLIVLLSSLATSFVLSARGVPFARHFAVAYSCLVSAIMIWLIPVLGLGHRLWWGSLTIPFGHMMELAVLSHALTIRFQITNDEKKNAEITAGEARKLNTLIRVLSHDLNNQLAVVMGFAKVGLKHVGVDHEKAKSAFEKISRAANAQHDIIEHVRVMRALEDGKVDIQLTSISIRDIARLVMETFDERLRAKNLSLKVDAANISEKYIWAEKSSVLHQVLNNLVSNAIKFSHPGSTIDITASAHPDGTTRLSVRDHGVGMDAELCVKIFDTSTPTSHTGTSGEKGTGFGMPVVKSYMRLYGGDIKVRSWPQAEHKDSSGTEMTLIFKTASAPATQAAA